MDKPNIYKAYDEVFNNAKMQEVKKSLNDMTFKIKDIDEYHTKRLTAFMQYCKEFMKDKNAIYKFGDYRLTYENSVEEKRYGNTWDKVNDIRYGSSSYTNFIDEIQDNLTKEGMEIFHSIQSFDKNIMIPNKRYNVGIIQPYHKEYFRLPSYSDNRTDYPINLILKEFYGKIDISMPAFHRYPIGNDYATDADSLKRQMLLVEYHDEIMIHIKPIKENIDKQYIDLTKNRKELDEITAKYEILINI